MTLQTLKNYQGYSKKYTRNGFICYYFNNRRTAKIKIPKEILNTLPNDREVVFTEIRKRTINKPYTGFTFLLSHGRKIYMLNGERIPKRIITDEEFDKMRNREEIWKTEYKKYFKSQNQNQFPEKQNKQKTKQTNNENKTKKEKVTKQIPSNPHDLLKKYNINNKKDWKKWMLKNHPDKNPNTDIELVKLINMAVGIMFG